MSNHHVSEEPEGRFFGSVLQEVGTFFLRRLDLLQAGRIGQRMKEAVTFRDVRYLGTNSLIRLRQIADRTPPCIWTGTAASSSRMCRFSGHRYLLP